MMERRAISMQLFVAGVLSLIVGVFSHAPWLILLAIASLTAWVAFDTKENV